MLSSIKGVKRWYYLLKEDHRVSLVTVGMPLEQWIESKAGAAFLIVGTREIIGEFEGNKHLTGKKGLQMKMQPLLWMRGRADRAFMDASECLATLSEQILDLPAIERSQEQIRGRYQWKDK